MSEQLEVERKFRVPTRLRMNILRFLKKYGDWIVSKEIEKEFDIEDPTVRGAFNDLRHMNEPVVSGNKGYKYTDDVEEYRKYRIRMENQAEELRRSAESMIVTERNMVTNNTKTYDSYLNNEGDEIIIVNGRDVPREWIEEFNDTCKTEEDKVDVLSELFKKETMDEILSMCKYGFDTELKHE